MQAPPTQHGSCKTCGPGEARPYTEGGKRPRLLQFISYWQGCLAHCLQAGSSPSRPGRPAGVRLTSAANVPLAAPPRNASRSPHATALPIGPARWPKRKSRFSLGKAWPSCCSISKGSDSFPLAVARQALPGLLHIVVVVVVVVLLAGCPAAATALRAPTVRLAVPVRFCRRPGCTLKRLGPPSSATQWRAVCLHQSSLRNKLDHSRRFNFSQSRSSLSISRQLSLHLHYPLCPACRRCQCRAKPSHELCQRPERLAAQRPPPQRRPGTSKTAQPGCAACVLPRPLLLESRPRPRYVPLRRTVPRPSSLVPRPSPASLRCSPAPSAPAE